MPTATVPRTSRRLYTVARVVFGRRNQIIYFLGLQRTLFQKSGSNTLDARSMSANQRPCLLLEPRAVSIPCRVKCDVGGRTLRYRPTHLLPRTAIASLRDGRISGAGDFQMAAQSHTGDLAVVVSRTPMAASEADNLRLTPGHEGDRASQHYG